MKFRNFFLAFALVAVAATFMACGQTGGAALSAIPDGEYQMVMSMNPNELLNSEFVKNVQESFPMAEAGLAGVKEQAEESGIKLEEIGVVSVIGTPMGEMYSIVSGTFKPEDAIAAMEESKGLSLKEVEENGVKYFADEEADQAIYFVGNAAVQTNTKSMAKLLETVADEGKKYIDGEAYKKASKYFDQSQTISIYASMIDKRSDLPGMAGMMFTLFEEDPEKLAALGEAIGKMEGVGAKFKVTKAITGNFSLILSDADAAKLLADFFNTNKDKMFEKAAEQAEQAAAMMPSLIYDKEKVVALKNAFNFKSAGNDLVIEINLSWDDISFMFAEKE